MIYTANSIILKYRENFENNNISNYRYILLLIKTFVLKLFIN